MIGLRSTVPLLLASALVALDLPGTGEGPGQREPAWWFTWGNDYLGNGAALRNDDYRTNRFDGGVTTGSWRWAADWSNLTVRRPRDADPDWTSLTPHAAATAGAERIDEATLSATRTWAVPMGVVSGGPAVRLDGDLGGEQVQAVVHTATESRGVDPRYVRRSVRVHPGTAVRSAFTLVQAGPWFLGTRTSTLITTRTEVQAEASLRTGLTSQGSAVWIGPLQAWRGGSAGSWVARRVADDERGTWITAGIEAPGVGLSMGNRLGGGAVEGRLTFRQTLDQAPAAAWPCEAEAGVIPGGSLPRVNEWVLRVRSGLPGEGAWRQRVRLVVEGVRGEMTLPATYEMSGRYRRVMAGPHLDAWPTPAAGVVMVPYAGVTGGWTWTDIRPESTLAIVPSTAVTTPTASVEGGVRLGWAAPTWRSGLVLSMAQVWTSRERIIPWSSTQGTSGQAQLAGDGTEIAGRWWVGIGW